MFLSKILAAALKGIYMRWENREGTLKSKAMDKILHLIYMKIHLKAQRILQDIATKYLKKSEALHSVVRNISFAVFTRKYFLTHPS